jgi:hypothetical protein
VSKDSLERAVDEAEMGGVSGSGRGVSGRVSKNYRQEKKHHRPRQHQQHQQQLLSLLRQRWSVARQGLAVTDCSACHCDRTSALLDWSAEETQRRQWLSKEISGMG